MVYLKKLVFVVLLQIVTAHQIEEKVRYDNYTVYRIVPKTEETVKLLQHWQENQLDWSFWSNIGGVEVPVDIMVPPSYRTFFDDIANYEDMSASVMIENVQEKIDNEGVRPMSQAGTFSLKSYHTLDEIYGWLKNLSNTYPDKVTLINIGKTYEKRDILVVKVSFKKTPQKAVFIESNIHAREWISGAVSSYILNEILTSKNETVRTVAESHDWYILPIANPDGFVYSHTKNRLWRKTRVPYPNDCYGADPNRNWAFHWAQGGTSNEPCSEIYQGPMAFSEPCTKILSDYISKIGKDLVAYIDFHSYSQLLMLPYGYTAQHLDNYDKMYPVGLKAKEVLARRYHTQYRVGDIAETIYVAAGTSADWVKGTFHTPIVFAYELRDQGRYGFLLPAEQIIPTGEETLDSLLTILTEGEKTI